MYNTLITKLELQKVKTTFFSSIRDNQLFLKFLTFDIW